MKKSDWKLRAKEAEAHIDELRLAIEAGNREASCLRESLRRLETIWQAVATELDVNPGANADSAVYTIQGLKKKYTETMSRLERERSYMKTTNKTSRFWLHNKDTGNNEPWIREKEAKELRRRAENAEAEAKRAKEEKAGEGWRLLQECERLRGALKPAPMRIEVREACRRRMPLDGADAQALEHAITITEKERDTARAECEHHENKVQKIAVTLDNERARADKAEAECERLRIENSAAHETLESAEKNRREMREECERLRARCETLTHEDAENVRKAWAEANRMRPVVDAACAKVKAYFDLGIPNTLAVDDFLDEAVDAYHATEAPKCKGMVEPNCACSEFGCEGIQHLYHCPCHPPAPDGAPEMVFVQINDPTGWEVGPAWSTDTSERTAYILKSAHLAAIETARREALDAVCGLFEAESDGYWDTWFGYGDNGFQANSGVLAGDIHNLLRAAILEAK